MKKKLLVIAPHPDDEMIGVGGTIAKRIAAGDEVSVCIVTKGEEPLFSAESVERTRSECRAANRLLGIQETIFLDFPAVMLETVPRYAFNAKLSEVIQQIQPDEVYIPHRGDMQIDHQLVVDAIMVAVRPKYKHIVKKLYAYETLSETGWNIPTVQNEFIPNAFVDIGDYLDKKLEALQIYQSQMEPFPGARSLGAVEALAKYRGALMNMMAAEAFMLLRELD